MSNRLLCALAVSVLLGTPSVVAANPVTYDFSGYLESPVNGPGQFSGSFTINSNPTVSNTDLQPPYYPYYIYENGKDVSLSVTLNGYVMNYINSLKYPDLATVFSGMNPSSLPPAANPSGDSITVGGVPAYSDPGYNPGFWLQFSSPSDTIFSQLGPGNVANLQNFNFSALYDASAQYTDMSGVIELGKITSIQEVPAPEPSTFVVFAILGVSEIVRLGRRGSSGNPIAH